MLGAGHLAAAVRVQLRERTLLVGCGVPPAREVFVACADFECAPSFADANRRALSARSPLLFAALAHRAVKLGPFVVPFETACFECHPPQSWDFSPTDFEWRFMRAGRDAPLNADMHLRGLARFAASLIVGELAALRLAAESPRLGGCVAKFDPPCREPERRAWPRASGCRACGSGDARSGRDSGQP